MAQHTVVNLGSMHGFQIDSMVKNIVPAVNMDNGSHVVIASTPLVKNEIDCYNVVAPTDVANDLVMLMVSPEIVEIAGYRVGIQGADGIANFYNKQGEVSGGYILGIGDDYVMTADGFSSMPTVGQYAIPANGSTKLAPSATDDTNTRLVYQVTNKESIRVGSKRIDAYRLLVVKS